MENLLAVIEKRPPLGEVAVDAVIGFAVVFAGISVLILIVWLIGKLFNKVSGKKTADKDIVETAQPIEKADDIGDDELFAVITAAVAAVYAKENRKAEFTVRKINRIKE